MNKIYYLYIFAAALVLLTALYTLITAKNITKNKKSRYLIVSLFIVIISSVLLVNTYYDDLFKNQLKNIEQLINKNNFIISETKKSLDSLDIEELEAIKLENKKFIDSIKKQNLKLLDYKNEIEKVEKIIGEKSEVISEITRKVTSNNENLNEIEKYNKRLSTNILEKKKGNKYSGNSSKFLFECPKNYESDVLELSLTFIDESIVNDIAYITISFLEKINDKEYNHISEEVFEPQNGINLFKVKNQFKNRGNKKINMQIAYTLKSEADKEYPKLEQITCRNY